MNSDPQTVKQIFLQAIESHSPADWPLFVDQACDGDQQLRERVEILLAAHANEGSLLDAPAMAPVATMDLPLTEQPGTVIGRYKLMEEIAEGGMGVVYVAEQTEPVRRKVALKIIKPGMDSKQVIARFDAERQALALMDHPHIAQVYDGGTTATGRPYFVMELVRGIPITEFCDNYKFTPRQRLELFIHVCQAIQHAHQKGIIHRDIKPSNVLVTLHDDEPVVKVIDFGVAKAINQELTQQTLYTNFAQLVGTPLYMSPEQTEMNALDVDTRSDIYSLGVLLYELLSGSTPFDKQVINSAGFDEMRRLIREVEPPRPSQRLTTLDQESRSTVSQRRSVDQRQLERALRGELDWIVMKALEKSRKRRYETASAMAADIGRYLNNEPVLACPPSAAYRLAKFARRNKALIITASLVAASLLLGIVATTWQAMRVTREQERTAHVLEESRENEREAEQKAAEAAALSNFLIKDLLTAVEPEHAMGHDVTVLEVLANAEAKIDSAFEDQPLVEASVRLAIGRAYLSLGKYETARRHFARACELRTQLLGREHRQTMSVMVHLVMPLSKQGKYMEAERLTSEMLEILRRESPPDQKRLLAAMQNHAISLAQLGRYSEAEALMREALEGKRRTLGPDHYNTLNSMNNIAGLLRNQGKYEESEKLHRQVLELRRRTLGPEHPKTMQTMCSIAQVLYDQKKYAESEKLGRQALEAQRRILGADHPGTLHTMNGLACALWGQAKFEEARRLAQQALDRQQQVLGREHPDTLISQFNLAQSLEGLGHWAEARALREEVLKLSGEKHHAMAAFIEGLALNIALSGDASPDDRQRAIELAEEAVELDLENEESWRTLGVAQAVSGHWQKSLEAFEHALQLGYRDELVPPSTLERLRQSDDGDDDLRDQLLEFLRENPGESQTDKRAHTNSTIGREQDSDTE